MSIFSLNTEAFDVIAGMEVDIDLMAPWGFDVNGDVEGFETWPSDTISPDMTSPNQLHPWTPYTMRRAHVTLEGSEREPSSAQGSRSSTLPSHYSAPESIMPISTAPSTLDTGYIGRTNSSPGPLDDANLCDQPMLPSSALGKSTPEDSDNSNILHPSFALGESPPETLDSTRVKCPLDCGTTVARQADIKRHLNEQHLCDYPGCEELEFPSRIDRDEHRKSHSEHGGKYVCGSCLMKGRKSSFERVDKLKSHFGSIHKVSGELALRLYQCTSLSCRPAPRGGVYFASSADRERHTVSKHTAYEVAPRPREMIQAASPSLSARIVYQPYGKHTLDSSSKPKSKRHKGPRSASASPGTRSGASCSSVQAAQPSHHGLPFWNSEMTLIASIRMVDLGSLVKHAGLPNVIEQLKLIHVTAVFIRSTRAITLRGALSPEAVKQARALLNPLVHSVMPKEENSGWPSGTMPTKKFLPRSRPNRSAPSTQILAVNPALDTETMITYNDYIIPQLSSLTRDAGIGGAYSVILVRQRDDQNIEEPVILFQSAGQWKGSRVAIRRKIKMICYTHNRATIPICFNKGKMVQLVGSTSEPSTDDQADDVGVPHQARYFMRPGLSASIGMGQCEHYYATLGGYILVGGSPYMLTVDHFIQDAYQCKECPPRETLDNSLSSPAKADIIALNDILDNLLRSYDLQMENSDSASGKDDVDLSQAIELIQSNDAQLIFHYERFRRDLARTSTDFAFGKVLKRSSMHPSPFVVPHHARPNDRNVKLHRMDWAIFEIEKERLGSNRLRHPAGIDLDTHHFDNEATNPQGTGELCERSREFLSGETVYYVGNRSGYREGTISPMPMLFEEDGIQTLEWCMIPLGQEPISEEEVQGDSGAWILAKSDNNVLGLLWGCCVGGSARFLLFTPIGEVFFQISSAMGNCHVEVAPLDMSQVGGQALPYTPISGNRKRSPLRKATRTAGIKKMLFHEEPLAKPKYPVLDKPLRYATIQGRTRSSSTIKGDTNSTAFVLPDSRSPSPAPSLVSSESSASDSSVSDPPSPVVGPLALSASLYDLADPLKKLYLKAQLPAINGSSSTAFDGDYPARLSNSGLEVTA